MIYFLEPKYYLKSQLCLLVGQQKFFCSGLQTDGTYAETTMEVVVFSGAYWLAWLSLAAKVKAGSQVRGKRANWKGCSV